eukprot:294115-Pelagomonas_calceolata.AAC.1
MLPYCAHPSYARSRWGTHRNPAPGGEGGGGKVNNKKCSYNLKAGYDWEVSITKKTKHDMATCQVRLANTFFSGHASRNYRNKNAHRRSTARRALMDSRWLEGALEV